MLKNSERSDVLKYYQLLFLEKQKNNQRVIRRATPAIVSEGTRTETELPIPVP
jgi:hypothetical protein